MAELSLAVQAESALRMLWLLDTMKLKHDGPIISYSASEWRVEWGPTIAYDPHCGEAVEAAWRLGSS